MSCTLCHRQGEHSETCPSRIRVDWDTQNVKGSAWESLCREIFEEWANDSIHETEPFWKDTIVNLRHHIEDGDVYSAFHLMRVYRNWSKTDGRR